MVNMKQENASCFFDFYGLVLSIYYINDIIKLLFGLIMKEEGSS